MAEAIRREINTTSFSVSGPNARGVLPGVTYLAGDLGDPNSIALLRDREFDYVVNAGGYINHAKFRDGGDQVFRDHFSNLPRLAETLFTDRLLRFIQLGSSDEYGSAPAPQREDMREVPISPYSAAKVCAAHYLHTLAKTDRFPSVVLRLFLTYGPGQDFGRFLPQIIKGCISGQEFPVSEGGQLRDFCHISDTVGAIFACFEKDEAVGNLFNVGSGRPVTIKNMIESVIKIIGDGRPQYGEVPYRAGENMALYPDVQKIKQAVGWEAGLSLKEGLEDTISWYLRSKP